MTADEQIAQSYKEGVEIDRLVTDGYAAQLVQPCGSEEITLTFAPSIPGSRR